MQQVKKKKPLPSVAEQCMLCIVRYLCTRPPLIKDNKLEDIKIFSKLTKKFGGLFKECLSVDLTADYIQSKFPDICRRPRRPVEFLFVGGSFSSKTLLNTVWKSQDFGIDILQGVIEWDKEPELVFELLKKCNEFDSHDELKKKLKLSDTNPVMGDIREMLCSHKDIFKHLSEIKNIVLKSIFGDMNTTDILYIAGNKMKEEDLKQSADDITKLLMNNKSMAVDFFKRGVPEKLSYLKYSAVCNSFYIEAFPNTYEFRENLVVGSDDFLALLINAASTKNFDILEELAQKIVKASKKRKRTETTSSSSTSTSARRRNTKKKKPDNTKNKESDSDS